MSSKNLSKIIVVLGPTAAGKTKLAVKLARKFNGEIVSADSRQVYCGIDIGTGKDLKEYKFIPHHLIDIINPNQKFNVAKYKKLALRAIKDILRRGKLPIIVGGTGLYISAIVDNYEIPKVKPDLKLRNKLMKMSLAEKIKLLKKSDSKSLEFVDTKNPRRLDRALEVCMAGYKFSELRQKSKPIFDCLQIGITPSKKILDECIDKRVDEMIKNGLVDETKKLIKKFSSNAVPLQTIGYKEIVDYLDNVDNIGNNVGAYCNTPLQQKQKIINLIKIHTHQFAKRQMTWFKRDKRIKWVKNYRKAEILLTQFLQK
ncbi:tRNA (adenosine(37)-N6)-dimethylallyltransferase MiaA [Candidatus Kuenenbacteria bacterium CG23_combo_of_CG06-09_8_20_14_all_36_9]|uniref:tRNA dimethylallyltransferase n=1 Tax=Candidatus Kuenenbacteria bacterium CG10_big_fil_rev_8_21_14_0_10_36_11 TaxID=1974618 RepID=A0A2M6WBG8_9BACT|nr:MAG: tRNA (adenosine(37)-N6)-dimethylallyltransferase MiaA [Candidatus Kuenenbacteria bacterium CG23_combo_of_CG06-09_8_20_14_all_36_9]PIT90136.1 MAG: tRNA (adenosine(37)-N6)-dimethylallyltransferase MiaA [Candidatus Kuenenbacteria bacterium CG10_big_fil_rev_8_21_14_0_10_36_11]